MSGDVVRLPRQPARKEPRQSPQLSDAMLRRLQPTGAERYFADTTPGLRLRQTKAGKLIWEFQAKLPGRRAPFKQRIGAYPGTSISAARRRARQLRAEIDEGKDLAAEREAAKAAAQQAEASTFTALVRQYREIHLPGLKVKTRGEYERIIDAHLLPAFASTPAADLDRDRINQMLDPLRRAGRGPMARSVFNCLSSVLSFGVDRGFLASNPCLSMRRPAPPRSRDRVLNAQEITLLWDASYDLHSFTVPARLLLLTGARRHEIAGMAWSELDLTNGTWEIPAFRSKNGVAHTLDLCPLALDQLAGVQRRDGTSVFGQGDRPLGAWSHAKARLDRRMAELARERGLDVPPEWRWHDLRRTVATGLAGLGCPGEVIEKLLNHQSSVHGPLSQIYQRHAFRAERRDWLLRWGDHLAQLVGEH
jgi:integrase